MIHVACVYFFILDSSVDHEIEFDDKPTPKSEQQSEDGKYPRYLYAWPNVSCISRKVSPSRNKNVWNWKTEKNIV